MDKPTQRDFLFYTHMGLGDYLLTSGLVRRLHQELKFENFYIMTKDIFHDQVSFLYRDLPDMKFLESPDDSWDCPTQWVPHQKFDAFPGMKLKLFMWHLEPNVEIPPDHLMTQLPEAYWYTSLGFSFNDRYDYFHIERDLARESEVFNDVVGNVDGEYLFIADDASRNYIIETNRVYPNHNYRIINASDYLHYTLFDLIGVAEKAKSCHVMWNSFFMLVDGLNGKTNREFTDLYLHETYLNNGLGKIEKFQPGRSPNVAAIYRKFFADRNITLV